jgi:nucleoside-diphosphate-sugar epimerase
VDDINDFHLLCMNDARTNGEVYNLGSGENFSVREIFDAVADLLGSDLHPIHQPDLPGEAQVTLADVGKARALGWQPRVGLREGLLSSIEFIKSEVAKGRV